MRVPFAVDSHDAVTRINTRLAAVALRLLHWPARALGDLRQGVYAGDRRRRCCSANAAEGVMTNSVSRSGCVAHATYAAAGVPVRFAPLEHLISY